MHRTRTRTLKGLICPLDLLSQCLQGTVYKVLSMYASSTTNLLAPKWTQMSNWPQELVIYSPEPDLWMTKFGP